MSKKNYTNYFKGEPETKPEEVKVEESVVEAVEETVDENENTGSPVAEEAVEEPKTTVGMVMNCTKLNIRKSPMPNAEVLCTVDVNTELTVDVENSTINWVKVCTASGVEGYCMKQFVSIV